MAVTTPFATIEEAVEEIRDGRFVVVVDDEDRENEGDLVIAAQFATPETVNFMATHGRGLICLCLTEERADRIGLRPTSSRRDTCTGCARGPAASSSASVRRKPPSTSPASQGLTRPASSARS